MKNSYYLLFISLSILSFSCDDSEEDVIEANQIEYLDTFEEVGNTQAALIKTILSFTEFADLSEASLDFKYDVRHYKVTYKTTYRNEEIIASGLVSFPITEDPMPILSFQNGTNTDNSSAPSEDLITSRAISGLASTGYIFAFPDYIGFGASANIVPPYHHAEYCARAAIDLMKATKELALEEGFVFNEEVFLAGYSEGGYATMATHLYFEQEQPEGFSLKASAPASGGYDVKGFQEYLFELETYGNPFYLAFVALSYREAYQYDDPLSDLFQEPYASAIPALFDGSNGGGTINNQLSETISELLQPEILANINTDPQYSDFVSALNENSLINWQPQAPMYMFHGTEDLTVPYQNSLDTYDLLIANGASTETVQLFDLQGANHSTGVLPYVIEALQLFEALK